MATTGDISYVERSNNIQPKEHMLALSPLAPCCMYTHQSERADTPSAYVIVCCKCNRYVRELTANTIGLDRFYPHPIYRYCLYRTPPAPRLLYLRSGATWRAPPPRLPRLIFVENSAFSSSSNRVEWCVYQYTPLAFCRLSVEKQRGPLGGPRTREIHL